MFILFSALRRGTYAIGLFRVRKAGIPVVVVGNITAGGTGKTPVVVWLAEKLRAHGYRPAIISRGYGGKVGREPQQVNVHSDPDDCGDEPVMLAQLTGAPVVVCRDRLAAAEQAARLGANVIIADDGLQHYRLHRDAEIAVVDGTREFGNGRRLPAGPLREAVDRLQTVDAVLVNGGAAEYGRRFDLRIKQARRLQDDELCPMQNFAGREVWAIAGIGNPARFFAALRELNVTVREVALADHGRIDLGELQREAQLPVLMTEKDAVKYAGAVGGDVWCVPATIDISEADANATMEQVLSRLPSVTP